MPRVPILMPQLGESIAEAIIVSLDIAPGDQVQADDEIMEVETQKATMEITTSFTGKVVEITAEVGESYPVGATLGTIEVSEAEAQRVGADSVSSEPTTPGPGEAEPREPAEPSSTSSVVQPTVKSLPVPAGARGATYLSPRMRARMDELDINASDLAGIAGSGAAGRVTVEDFEEFMAKLEEKKMTPASPMRIAVADSMRRSWSRPLATVGSPVQLDRLLAHRKTATPKPGPALYIVRALALALAENTATAGRLIGSRIVHPDAIDIGFAVEVEDGVLVPVIRQVDKKPLSNLVSTYNELVELARAKRLPKEASQPGIATVTNFGTFGIAWATPIPLPEQNLVLGLGAGRKKPTWDESSSSWLPVTEAEITLSFDHRILDGGAAGRLLARIAELLQAPEDL